jgi:hypothetical protein
LQEALQQSSAGTVCIHTSMLDKDTAGAAVQLIAAWISKYPGLVGELEWDIPFGYVYGERSAPEAVAFCRDAEAAMTAAFQRAAAAADESSAAKAHPQLVQQQQHSRS